MASQKNCLSYIKIFSCSTIALLGTFSQAHAITFAEAVQASLSTNPSLIAIKQQVKATKETQNIAKSGYRPDIRITGSAGYAYNDTNISGSTNLNPWGATATITQPIYKGGTTAANVNVAEMNTAAQAAYQHDMEQTVTLQTAKAYLDVLRYQEVIRLNQHNVTVLDEQLIAEQQKFKLGNSTRTDVAQAESRLSASRANLQSAMAQLDIAKAQFVQTVGQYPENLDVPIFSPQLPETQGQALDIALSNNAMRESRLMSHKAARRNIDSINGELLPQLSLVGSAGYNEEISSQIDESTDASIKLSLTIPLYQSGSVQARKQQALATAEQRRYELSETERQITKAVDEAWANYKAIQSVVLARKSQVKASDIALEGVREESKIGSRTTLDVLDAEQEYLDAQVSLVESEFDQKYSILTLLRAMGTLKIENLGF